jgi:hypothetical protein
VFLNLRDIDTTVNSQWATNGDELAMKKALKRGLYHTLNFYFVKSLDAKNTRGACTYPVMYPVTSSTRWWKDGCTIMTGTMPGGTVQDYNLGHTATHEAGHWFGLLHTYDGFSCDGSGDHISDTPQQKSGTVGCPNLGRDSCVKKKGLDPIHNFMDDSSDVCLTEFTQGQRKRIVKYWDWYRAPN